MILSYDAYATLMFDRWNRIVTPADYTRYVRETVIDRAIAKQTTRAKIAALDF